MNRLKRYAVTAAVLFVVASSYSMWRVSCSTGCGIHDVVLGWPVFLRTPYTPGSGTGSVFLFVPFLINVAWITVASACFWVVAGTFGRWSERRQLPPPY